ncbi:MAG TPA: gamma-glutamyl-gamma-aminobutyrate hydrolase family protein [Kiritimatiellia bacterium]|nr:gamma-glutamyl-gamma-aminobutyrate hydrolase family protein [Kiritimatiellia bacterium]HRZ10965.1 gamma-glutamyl-gamma-aminobutyrate hydrolase family protein [Kiritimatiellia bacterium]HSA18538.1 gamma-glutamyl-gamma-aminobutyrate hydrolase family protein [Kiritimatiellia bacterium]
MTWLVSSTLRDEADRRYARWLASAGVPAEWVRPGDPVPASFEALLLTGGGDVDPDLYGAARQPRTDAVNRARDVFEIMLVRAALEARRPVFGICRGIQVVGVALGGRLIQHIPDICPAAREVHAQVEGRDSGHPVEVEARSRLASVLGPRTDVNSAHHQAVDPAAPGRGLKIAARSPAGIVEAVEADGIPVMAVQWHPERMPPDHPASRALLQLFRTIASERDPA